MYISLNFSKRHVHILLHVLRKKSIKLNFICGSLFYVLRLEQTQTYKQRTLAIEQLF